MQILSPRVISFVQFKKEVGLSIKVLIVIASFFAMLHFGFPKKDFETQNSASITPDPSSEKIISHFPLQIPALRFDKKQKLSVLTTETDESAAACCGLTNPKSFNQVSDNWNLSAYGLPAETILPFFSKSEAKERGRCHRHDR